MRNKPTKPDESLASFADLVDRFCGQAKLARDLCLPYATVSSWKRRDFIPPAYWEAVIAQGRLMRVSPPITIEHLRRLGERHDISRVQRAQSLRAEYQAEQARRKSSQRS